MHVSIIRVLGRLEPKNWSPGATKLCLTLSLSLGLFLGGCSVLQSLFENSPQLLFWWIDGFVDFDGAQTQKVKAALNALQALVRQKELPLLLEQVKLFEDAAQGELSPDLSCQALPFLYSRVPPLLHALTPALADILPTLSETQIKHIRKRFEDKNKDWSDEWIKPQASKVLEQQTDKGIEQAQDLYGKLSLEQKQLIRASAKASGYNAQTALAIRLEHQSLTLSTLNQIRETKEKPLTHEELEELIQSWAQQLMRSPNPQFRTYQENRASFNCQAVVQFHASTTTEQRLNAQKRLKRYERDLIELMANNKS